MYHLYGVRAYTANQKCMLLPTSNTDTHLWYPATQQTSASALLREQVSIPAVGAVLSCEVGEFTVGTAKMWNTITTHGWETEPQEGGRRGRRGKRNIWRWGNESETPGDNLQMLQVWSHGSVCVRMWEWMCVCWCNVLFTLWCYTCEDMPRNTTDPILYLHIPGYPVPWFNMYHHHRVEDYYFMHAENPVTDKYRLK